MAKSKTRKGHKQRVKARNERIKNRQNAFIKMFKEQMNAGVSEEIQKQADQLRAENEAVNPESRTIDTTMSTPPVK